MLPTRLDNQLVMELLKERRSARRVTELTYPIPSFRQQP